jgi:hypothetical protein
MRMRGNGGTTTALGIIVAIVSLLYTVYVR